MASVGVAADSGMCEKSAGPRILTAMGLRLLRLPVSSMGLRAAALPYAGARGLFLDEKPAMTNKLQNGIGVRREKDVLRGVTRKLRFSSV